MRVSYRKNEDAERVRIREVRAPVFVFFSLSAWGALFFSFLISFFCSSFEIGSIVGGGRGSGVGGWGENRGENELVA